VKNPGFMSAPAGSTFRPTTLSKEPRGERSESPRGTSSNSLSCSDSIRKSEAMFRSRPFFLLVGSTCSCTRSQ